ncbi:hypothetical protein D6C95_04019 [Aureobasidium pullulans]|nr:hypothetical protein D6C95_04019 [Aureobasidium pullulans]
MRRNPQRPRSGEGVVATPRTLEPPTKKIFNCIADDSALLAGAKKSTRDGIRKWIANGQIRLFVPLYTQELTIAALGQATRLKDGNGRISSDAEDALFWLDDATSTYPHLVTLQGGFEKFETWAEVEKFALPKTLFSEGDVEDEEVDRLSDDLAKNTESKLTVRDATLSMSSADTDSRSATPSSAHTARSSVSAEPPKECPPKNRGRTHTPKSSTKKNKSESESESSSGVPSHLRPLFNYILWRIHQELDPVAALESFIFLTDDPTKTKLAQRFGIRTKSLADIRFVVAREEREFKNRQVVQRKEIESNAVLARPDGRAATANVAATPVKEKDTVRPELLPVDERPAPVSDDEEDEVLLKRPPKAPAAMLAQHKSPKPGNKVMDPNQFSRGAQTPTRGNGNARGGSFRGNTPRGRGAASFAPGPSSRNVTPAKLDLTPTTNGNGPIDPNSFTRPSANTNKFRGGRRLWVPT